MIKREIDRLLDIVIIKIYYYWIENGKEKNMIKETVKTYLAIPNQSKCP